MKPSIIFAALILASMLFACSEHPPAPAPPDDDNRLTPADLTPTDHAVASSANHFGLELWRTAVEDAENNENLFVSPISVTMALGMTMNGAAGETRQQIENSLHLSGLTQTEINQSYQTLRRLLTGLDNDVKLTIANSIWARLGLPLVDDFVVTNETFFDAVVRSLDFNRPDAADTINAWVKDNTDGTIDKIIDGQINPSIVMYLINAIHFKAAWTVPFDPDSTVEDMFFVGETDSVACMMMNKLGYFHFKQTDEFMAIELPYGDSSFAMLALLPHEGISDDSILTSLTPESWIDWTDDLVLMELPVTMPRFKIEYETSLKNTLQAMGMIIPFRPDADFSDMVEGGGIWISDVKHKTFVEVNEEGTEAAAVTSVVMVTSLPPSFVANRPFLFFIYERSTRTIIFAGRLADPSVE